MPRKGHVSKREVLPDPLYNSKTVTKLINSVMLDGKKGVAPPIIGATKTACFADAAGTLGVKLSPEDAAYLDEMYVLHPVVGAIEQNLPQGVVLLDEKK